MSTKTSAGLITILIALIISVAWLWVNLSHQPQIGYVKIQEVFDGFDMKKELQSRLEKTDREQKKQLDSLTFELQILSDKLNRQKKPSESDVLPFNRLKQV